MSSEIDDSEFALPLPLPDEPVEIMAPRRPATLPFGTAPVPAPVSADSFEADLEGWIRNSGKLFYIELTEFQISRLMHHAKVFHRKHGGR